MEAIKVLIVEDEWIVSEEIKEVLKKNGFEITGQAEDAVSALKMARENKPDIALLDVNIKGDLDGIQLAHQLNESIHCGIIFLSAYEDAAFINRAKEVNPHAYLVKPFREANVVIALKLAFHKMSVEQEEPTEEMYMLQDRVFIKDGSRFFKLEISKIKYVTAEGSYCEIHTDQHKYTLAINLKCFEGKIADPALVRVHRSYLVNLEYVDALEGNMIFIGEKSIPVSETYQENVMRRLRII